MTNCVLYNHDVGTLVVCIVWYCGIWPSWNEQLDQNLETEGKFDDLDDVEFDLVLARHVFAQESQKLSCIADWKLFETTCLSLVAQS